MGSPGNLASWHDDWSSLSVVVWGLGDDGFAVADTLVELGAQVSVLAEVDDPDRSVILEVLGVETQLVSATDAPAITVKLRPDLLVVAPEWSGAADVVGSLREEGITVWPEAELSSRVVDKVGDGPRMVYLVGHSAAAIADIAHRLLMAAGIRSFLAGLGASPALDAIRLPDGVDVVLVTLEPRQLALMVGVAETRRNPLISVAIDEEQALPHELLLELYRDTSLACIYRRGAGPTEAAVEDAWVVEGARAIGVGLDTPGRSDLGRVEDILCDRAFLDDRADRALELCTTAELEAAGFDTPSKVEAALAAFAIARAFSVPPELIGQELAAWAEPRQ